MGLKPDHWIRKMALEEKMIEPFEDKQVRNGVISYGVSSYGYDVRVANEFKIFTNVFSATVDPKNFDTKSMVDFVGDVCIVPPNSFALARTVGWIAQLNEMIGDPEYKIGRPRQLYVGAAARVVKPIGER